MFSRFCRFILLAAPLMVLLGCGAGVENPGPRREVTGITSSTSPIQAAAEEATAEEVDYFGWRGLRLTNGMVTLVAVPALGGRIMEYKLGGHPFLWTNPAERGKTYPAPRTETERVFHDFGGYKLWPAGNPRWEGPPDPLGSVLDSGQWTGRILTARGRNAEIELRSPEDKTTGLQITRVVKLFGGSSQVRVVERITNISSNTLEWSFCGWSQLPGSLERSERFSEKARLYIPLNPETTHKPGYVLLDQSGAGQFKVIGDNLLQVSYRGQQGRLGADSLAGWVASVDEAHDYAFIQRFEPVKLGEYPEQGSSVLVTTEGKQSVMQTALCTPKRSLRPQENVEYTFDWYATRVSGPVVSASEVTAVSEPLKVVRAEGKPKVTGIIGVFAPGNLAFILQDAEGKQIGQPTTLKVTPAEVTRVSQVLPEDPQAKKVLVELQNEGGTPLGQVAELSLAVTVAKVASETPRAE